MFASSARYNPSVSFGYSTNSNVFFVGSGGEETVSDETIRMSAQFPVLWSGVRSRVDFRYRVNREQFNRENEFDNTSHSVQLSVNRTLRNAAELTLTLGGSRSQDQGLAVGTGGDDLFLTQRTRRTLASVGLGYGGRVGPRWDWGISLGAGWASFDRVVDADVTGEPQAEDSRSYSTRLDIARQVSKLSSVGVRYEYLVLRPETNPDEEVHRLGLTFGRQLRSGVSLGAAVGAFHRVRDVEIDGQDFRDSGVDVSLDAGYGKDVGPVRFTFSLATSPAVGGGVAGSSTYYLASVQMTRSDFSRRSKWRWQLATRYGLRQPSERDLSDIHTVTFDGYVERPLGVKVGARVGFRAVDQTSGRVAGDDGSFTSAYVGLVWYPLAGTRWTGG